MCVCIMSPCAQVLVCCLQVRAIGKLVLPSWMVPSHQELIFTKYVQRGVMLMHTPLYRTHRGVCVDLLALTELVFGQMALHHQGMAMQDPLALRPDGSPDPTCGVMVVMVKLSSDAAVHMGRKNTYSDVQYILLHPYHEQGKRLHDLDPDKVAKFGTLNKMAYTFCVAAHLGGDNRPQLLANLAADMDPELTQPQRESQWRKFTVKQLKEACALQSLPVSAKNKNILMDRLLRADLVLPEKQPSPPAHGTAAVAPSIQSVRAVDFPTTRSQATLGVGAPRQHCPSMGLNRSKCVPEADDTGSNTGSDTELEDGQHEDSAQALLEDTWTKAAALLADGERALEGLSGPSSDEDEHDTSSDEDDNATQAEQERMAQRGGNQLALPPKVSREQETTVQQRWSQMCSMNKNNQGFRFRVDPSTAPHGAPRPFSSVRVVCQPAGCFDMACWWAFSDTSPVPCIPRKGDKPHRCGRFCCKCDMAPCDRLQMWTVLSVQRITEQLRRQAPPDEEVTLRSISKYFMIPMEELLDINLSSRCLSPDDKLRHHCDCDDVVWPRSSQRSPAVKIPFAQRQQAADHGQSAHAGQEEGEPMQETQNGQGDLASYPVSALCQCKDHQHEGHYLKPMTVDCTAHLTPNISEVLIDSKTQGLVVGIQDKVLPLCLPDGSPYYVRTRFLAHEPYSEARYSKGQTVMGPSFEDKNMLIECMLHGLMRLGSAALHLLMVFILNISKDKDRLRVSKETKGDPKSRVELFNNRFVKYGLQLAPEAEGSSKYVAPDCKGTPAWSFVSDIGSRIRAQKDLRGEHTYSVQDPETFLLHEIDDRQESLALWYWLYQVFLVAKKGVPSKVEIAQYTVSTYYLKKAWRIRSSREMMSPYYLHLVCDHSPETLRTWGTLWPISNNIPESYNKILNTTVDHTTRLGANGRMSQAKRLLAQADVGELAKLKVGRAQLQFGLVDVFTRLLIRYGYHLHDSIAVNLVQRGNQDWARCLIQAVVRRHLSQRKHVRALEAAQPAAQGQGQVQPAERRDIDDSMAVSPQGDLLHPGDKRPHPPTTESCARPRQTDKAARQDKSEDHHPEVPALGVNRARRLSFGHLGAS